MLGPACFVLTVQFVLSSWWLLYVSPLVEFLALSPLALDVMVLFALFGSAFCIATPVSLVAS